MSLNSEEAASRKRAESAAKQRQKTIAAVYKATYDKALAELDKLWAKEGKASDKARLLLSTIKEVQRLYEKASGTALDENRVAAAEAYFTAFKGEEYAIGKTTGVATGFGVVPEDAIASAAKGGTVDIVKTFRKNDAKIRAKIRNTITRNLVLGKTIDEVATEIMGDFQNGYTDAIRVLRTETHRAYSEGQLDAIGAAEDVLGIKVVKIWKAFGGARDAHADMDGQRADDDGLFWGVNNLGQDVSAEGPGLFDDPEMSCNCRCTIIQEIEDEPSVSPASREDYPEYDEWIKEWEFEYASTRAP